VDMVGSSNRIDNPSYHLVEKEYPQLKIH